MNSRSEFTRGNTNGSALPIWAIAAYGYPPPAPIWMPANGNARYFLFAPHTCFFFLLFNKSIFPFILNTIQEKKLHFLIIHRLTGVFSSLVKEFVISHFLSFFFGKKVENKKKKAIKQERVSCVLISCFFIFKFSIPF